MDKLREMYNGMSTDQQARVRKEFNKLVPWMEQNKLLKTKPPAKQR